MATEADRRGERSVGSSSRKNETTRVGKRTGLDPLLEYQKRIEANQDLGALDVGLFGEKTSLFNGATEFRVVDIDIPGNSALPVQLSRRLKIELQPVDRVAPYDARLLGVGNWDIDVPHMAMFVGITSGGSPDWPQAACSSGHTPNLLAGPLSAPFYRFQFWHGFSVHVPGEGERSLLRLEQGIPTPSDGQSYTFTTASRDMLSCIPLVRGLAGEGFRMRTAQGLTYDFNIAVTRVASTLERLRLEDGGDGAVAEIPIRFPRARVYLLASRVTDRFGNSVSYTYNDQGFPTRIDSSDGRLITLSYPDGRLESAFAHGQSWSYSYSPTSGDLEQVKLPDDSVWSYASEGTLRPETLPLLTEPSAYIECRGLVAQLDANYTLSIGHPSGARGRFEFSNTRHGRSGVHASECLSEGIGKAVTYTLSVPNFSDVMSLGVKTISGGGLGQSLTWSYDYDAKGTNIQPLEGVRSDPAVYPCTNCLREKTVRVTEPDLSRVEYRYGIQYRLNDGRLLGRRVRTASSTVLLEETNSYLTDAEAATQGFSPRYGRVYDGDDPITADVRPLRQRTLRQQGRAFTWSASAYNALGTPTQITRNSSLGYRVDERLTYQNFTGPWILDQLSRVEALNTAGQVISIDKQLHRNGGNALVERVGSFGLDDVLGRSYHPDGNLRDVTMLNGSVVSFQDYRRGIPTSVRHGADNSSMAAAVDDFARIRCVIDPLGNPTGYNYDAVGRLTQTTFPGRASPGCAPLLPKPPADSTEWDSQNNSYSTRSRGEYGVPAGLWMRVQTRGRYEHVTWYDALWRPILTSERDVGLSGSQRFVRKQYDVRGNLSFESYPGNLANTGTSYMTLTLGISRQYDPLNRLTSETRSSELGNLVSHREYLPDFQVRETKVREPIARNLITTTSFMAYDEPTFDWPVQISEPEGRVTAIQRDRWGKPTSITRSGQYVRPDGSLEQNRATRSFVYDANQRLCKRIDPEHGATVMEYDHANRLAWTADGLSLPSTSQCDRGLVPVNQRVVRSYNTKDELIGIDYPDSTDDLSYSYYLDGKLQTASVGPLSNRVTRTYAFNKRRLPTEELLQIDGFSFRVGYRYSSEGDLSQLGYPDSTWEVLNPDGMGRPTTMGQFASNVTWHRFGPLAGFTYGPSGSGLSFSQSLNARGLPSERRDLWFGNARLHDTLSWDGNGNLTAITDNVGSVESFSNASRSMVYDGLDRLTIANSAPQPQLRTSTPWAYSWGEASFSYDGLDNIRTFKMASVDFTYAYDSNGRLQSVSQAWVPTPVVSYTHNARGQMTGRQFGGQQFTLNWDSAHRVTQTWNAASSVVEGYRYDAHGHRVRTVRGSETVYQVYTQAGDLLWETSTNGATRKYARLGGRLIGESVNGGRYAIHTDVIGSVRQKTDVLGTLVHEDVRAPYGSTLLGGEYQNGPAFTGHMEDGATGLTYMKARYYDPVAMRFLSPDPVYVDLSTGGNFNRYWYANNNPYTFTDPDGRFSRGTGWNDRQWSRFNNAQQSAARSLERGAAKIDKALDTGKGMRGVQRAFERNFGKGSATSENLARASADMRSMAGALRDTGPNAIPANAMTASELSSTFNAGAGTLAGVPTSGPLQVVVNIEHPGFRSGSTLTWGVGHESAHAVLGYKDQQFNGASAYKFGGREEKDAFKNLQSEQRLVNPDHLMDYVR